MKNTIKTILFLTVLVMTFTFCACKKHDHSMLQPKGDYEPAGDFGNTNIQSKIFDNNETFQWVLANGDWEDTLKYPALTQTILDKGSVLVYMQWSNDSTSWLTLPYSNPAAHFQVASSVGRVRICCDSNPNGSIKFKFKVVLLSPAARMAYPNVNFNDYSAVKRTFNLQD